MANLNQALEEISNKGLMAYTNSLPSIWLIYFLSIVQHIITVILPFCLIFMMSHLWFVTSYITYLEFAIGYIIVGLLLSTIAVVREQAFANLLLKYSQNISTETFKVMVKLPYTYLSNLPIESQYSRFAPLENFSFIWLNDIIKPLLDLPLVIFSFAAICLILGFAYFATVALILLLVIFISHFKGIISANNKSNITDQEYNGTLKDTLNNINLIKSHNRTNFFIDKNTDLIINKLTNNYITETKSQILANIADTCLLLIYITSLVFGVSYTLANVISIPYLIIILLLTWFSISPLKTILAVFDAIPKAKVIIKQYTNLLQINNPVHRQKKLEIDSNYNGDIILQNLNYRAPNGSKFFLNNVNLTIKKGDLLLVTGESGSGKSTLIKIIAGLLNPTSGYITIQHEVSLIDEDSLRDHLILLSTRSHLTSLDTPSSQESSILNKIPENTNNKIILLDEPFITHNLNTYNQFAIAINKIKNNNTIIIASRYTLYSSLATDIILLNNGAIERQLTKTKDQNITDSTNSNMDNNPNE